MGKEIICDSSALISLTSTCVADILPFIANKFKLTFLITESVEYESIIYPLSRSTKEYAFSALIIKNAMSNGTIVKVKPDLLITRKKEEILQLANNLFFAKGKPLTLMHAGEAEIIAFANELKLNHLLMDERTTRLLIEAPFMLKEHFEKEFNTNIMINRENINQFNSITKGLKIFRSSELLALAYENGYFDDYNELKKDVFSAALHKLKYSGCSIRYDEIEELLKAG